MSRLAELVPTYKDKLQDEEVFNNFKAVVSRTKSFATVEMKEAVAEWEAQLRKVTERSGGGGGAMLWVGRVDGEGTAVASSCLALTLVFERHS